MKSEELTASAVVSWRAVGTVFLTCLMETGPAAGVGFSLMAGSVMRWRHPRKGNFGKVMPLRVKKPGRMRVEKGLFLENGNGLLNARGWDINSAADPTWAKCLEFVYRVTSRARLPRLP